MAESMQQEAQRRLLTQLINEGGVPASYDGPLWTTEDMTRDFEAVGFGAPFVVVRRRSDRQKGTLTFVHSPRVYFDFQPTP